MGLRSERHVAAHPQLNEVPKIMGSVSDMANFFVSEYDQELAKFVPPVLRPGEVKYMEEKGRPLILGGGNYSQCYAVSFKGKPALLKLFRVQPQWKRVGINPMQYVAVEAAIQHSLANTNAVPKVYGLVKLVSQGL